MAVTGGVVSGLGKGITSSSIGVLLKAAGLNVTSIKIDPYLNSDAGTMSPYEHGEVYVLDDGGEKFRHGKLSRTGHLHQPLKLLLRPAGIDRLRSQMHGFLNRRGLAGDVERRATIE